MTYRQVQQERTIVLHTLRRLMGEIPVNGEQYVYDERGLEQLTHCVTIQGTKPLIDEEESEWPFAMSPFRLACIGDWLARFMATVNDNANYPAGVGTRMFIAHYSPRTWDERSLWAFIKVDIINPAFLDEAKEPETAKAIIDYFQGKPRLSLGIDNNRRPLLSPMLSMKDRISILKRDNYRCRLCGTAARDGAHVRLEVDHITPRSKGGSNDPTNLWTLCFACNRGKGVNEL